MRDEKPMAGTPARRAVVFRWTPQNAQLTTDLLDLVSTKAIWRNTFFSNDAGKGSKWQEARDIMLQLFSGNTERLYMSTLEQQGLIREIWVQRDGEQRAVWEAMAAWGNATALKTNPVMNRLKTLQEQYAKLQSEHKIAAAATASNVSEQVNLELAVGCPWFWQIHRITNNDLDPQVITHRSAPPNISARTGRTSDMSSQHTHTGAGGSRGARRSLPPPPLSDMPHRSTHQVTSSIDRQSRSSSQASAVPGDHSAEQVVGTSAMREPPRAPRAHRFTTQPESVTLQRQTARPHSRPSGLASSQCMAGQSIAPWTQRQKAQSTLPSTKPSPSYRPHVARKSATDDVARATADVPSNTPISPGHIVDEASTPQASGVAAGQKNVTGLPSDEYPIPGDANPNNSPQTSLSVGYADIGHINAFGRYAGVRARFGPPDAPIVPIKNEAQSEVASDMHVDKPHADAASRTVYGAPLIAAEGGDDKEAPKPKAVTQTIGPAVFNHVTVSGRRPTQDRMPLSWFNNGPSRWSIPAEMTWSEILDMARRERFSKPFDAQYILTGSMRDRLIDETHGGLAIKADHHWMQCVAYYHLGFKREIVIERLRDIEGSICTTIFMEHTHNDLMMMLAAFLKACHISVVDRLPDTQEAASGILITFSRTKGHCEPGKIRSLRPGREFQLLDFWRSLDRRIRKLLPSFEREILLQGDFVTTCEIPKSMLLVSAAAPASSFDARKPEGEERRKQLPSRKAEVQRKSKPGSSPLDNTVSGPTPRATTAEPLTNRKRIARQPATQTASAPTAKAASAEQTPRPPKRRKSEHKAPPGQITVPTLQKHPG